MQEVVASAASLLAALLFQGRQAAAGEPSSRRLAPPCGTPNGPPCPTEPPTSAPTSGPGANLGPHCHSVEDCLSNMTLDEKIGQMTQIQHLALNQDEDVANYMLGSLLSGGGGGPTAGNAPEDWADMVDRYQRHALSTRLGIPLIYGVDAVHGHSNVYGATIFPHNIGLGATRNPALVREVGRVTAEEVYATGIPWTFSPCLCVTRDERWGRSYECFGEDPELVANMTTIIDGYQGGGNLAAPNAILATAKHWIADGGTEGGDDQGDAVMSEEELRTIHMRPYIDAINRSVGSVMPSYSSWNGEKMHGNTFLLNDTLKGELGFSGSNPGFVISDWAAIDQLPGDYASDVRTAINAGNDMIMVPDNYELFTDTLRNKINNGNILMERIDQAIAKVLEAKFALGLFDNPFANRTLIGNIGSDANRQVARQAVRESLVLLKNDNTNILPLPKSGSTIVVAGKSANDIGNQCGGWTITWQGQSGDTTVGTTVFEAVQAVIGSGPGTAILNEKPNGRVTGDYGIVVVGERPYAEGQGDDQHLGLDNGDTRAINNVCNAMPCVVVLISGQPMLVEAIIGNSNVNAFVAAWLPGTEGGGITDVLFGDEKFVGKLPVTWPIDMNQVPINAGDSTYDPLFPYGFGLDY